MNGIGCRIRVLYGIVWPVAILITADLLMFNLALGKESATAASMLVVLLSIPGIPIVVSFNYFISRANQSSKLSLFARGLILPFIVVVLESLFIFRW